MKIPALTQLQKEAIKMKIDSYLQSKGISQNRFSEISKVSTANISNILNDKWEKISDEIWWKVEAVCQQDTVEVNEVSQQFRWRIIKGKGFLTIHNLCQDA